MKKIIIVCCFCFISGCQASNSDGKKAFIEDIRQYISVARQISHSTVNYKETILDGLYDSAKNKINLMTSDETYDARLISSHLLFTQSSISLFKCSIDVYYITRDQSKWEKILNEISERSRDMKRDIDILEQIIYAYENNESVKDVLERNKTGKES